VVPKLLRVLKVEVIDNKTTWIQTIVILLFTSSVFKDTLFQVLKVLQKKFTLLHADFSKIVLKYSNEVHLLRNLTPLFTGV
jgi:hypothetical protein